MNYMSKIQHLRLVQVLQQKLKEPVAEVDQPPARVETHCAVPARKSSREFKC